MQHDACLGPITLAKPHDSPAGTDEIGGSSRAEFRWTVAIAAVALLAWTAWIGRDLSWDVVNHHLYLPFALLSGRFATDFLAAGPQSTQNPIGFVPFYALVAAGLPNAAIGAVLAGVHALAAWPLHRIAAAVFGDAPGARLWRCGAVAMALLAPVFLLTAGTSSVDPLGALAVLAALALALRAPGSRRRAIGIGVCLGLAIAVKPTHLPFAVATFAVLGLQVLAGRWSRRRLAEAVLSTVVAVALAWGPWAWWVWQRFGNPFFPLANDVFRSPFFSPDAMVSWRFVPRDAASWLTRPFEFAAFRTQVYFEDFAADLRPALLVALALALAVVAAARWRRRGAGSGDSTVRVATLESRLRRACASPALQLGVYTAIVYASWLRSSGNGRYAIALFLLAGVVLVTLMGRLPPRFGRPLLLLVLVLQVGYGVGGNLSRLSPEPWSGGPYLDVEMPQRLRETPYLHLSIGTQSNAALALALHPDGALSNVSGQVSLPGDGPAGAAVAALVQRWSGRTRVLFAWADGAPGTLPPVSAQAQALADRVLLRFGLAVDAADCLRLQWRRSASSAGAAELSNPPLWSCAVRPAAVDARDARAAQLEADRLFALVEQRCPRWLTPRPLVSDPVPGGWERRYVNPDLRLTWVRGDGFYLGHHRQLTAIRLGSVDDVRDGRLYDPCHATERLRPP